MSVGGPTPPGGAAGEPAATVNQARFFEFSNDLMGILDFDGRILEVNPSTLAVLGYTRDALEGRSFWELIHPDDLDGVSAQTQAVLGGGTADDFECRFRHAEGRWVPIRWSIAADLETRTAFGVGRNMTQQRRQEERINEGAVFLKDLFRVLPDGVLAVDREGAVIRANRAALEIFGVGEARLEGMSVADLLPGGQFKAAAEALAAREGDGGSAGFTTEMQGLRGGDEVFPLRVTVLHWPESAGALILVMQDLTDLRQEEVRRAAENRRRQTTEIQLATARELHDGILQTLTAVGVRLSLAQTQVDTDPEALRETLAKVDEVVRAEQRELRLYVDELKAREPAWSDTALPLVERIQGVLQRIQTIWDVEGQLEVTDEGTVLKSSMERQIIRLIQEAVVNAARHGGAKTVQVRLELGVAEVRLTLSDDGQGFGFSGDLDDDELRRRRLGPVSLKQRVHANGGRIFIHSGKDGARMTIELPTRRKEAP